MDIRHKFKLYQQGLIDDPSNPQKVKPSNWDDNHELVEILLSDITTPSENDAVVVTDLLEAYNSFWSSGIISGGAITVNIDGTVSIASGETMIRSDVQANSPLFDTTFPAKDNIILVEDSTNYICAVYVASGGYCEIQNVGTDISDFNCRTSCMMWLVSKSGTHVHKVDARFQNLDSHVKHRRVLLESDPFRHASALGGTKLSNPSDSFIKVTAGKFYFGLSSITHDEFDTSIAGTNTLNVFRYYRTDGAGGWIATDNNKTIDNLNYDNNGVLTTIGNNRFKPDWVYLVLDNTEPHLTVIYGTQTYKTLAEADASKVPTNIPHFISNTGVFVGRIIVEYNKSPFAKVDGAFDTVISLSGTTAHNYLADLQGGQLNEYYHLTLLDYDKVVNNYFPTLTVGQVSGNTSFEADGTLVMSGSATTWDDLRVEPVVRGTGTNTPPFSQWFTNGAGSKGVYLYTFDDAVVALEKEIHFTIQMPHTWAGTLIHPHVHWVPSVAGTGTTPIWGLEYTWADIGSVFGNTNIVYTNGLNITGDGAVDVDLVQYKHYISAFATITPSVSQDGISSILIGRIFRNSSSLSDTFTGDCGLLYIDFHYEINTLGSRVEFTK